MIPKHCLTAECGIYDIKLSFNYNAANPIAVDRCAAIDDFESGLHPDHVMNISSSAGQIFDQYIASANFTPLKTSSHA
jgi:hypothetical protein